MNLDKGIILIDAYSQIFRGFYAVGHLSNSQGMPTNAIFVFFRILLKLHNEYPSKLGALVFDCGKVSFREELNPQYKKNRPPMPEELKIQIPVIRELAEAFGWPLVEQTEYEADDLIAAFAKEAKDAQVMIVSSDKDLAQSVNNRVAMLVPGSGGGFELRDEAGVVNRYNVRPDQMVDYLSLVGDSADNVAGIDGIGPKTAAKLLEQFGSIDNMVARAGEIEKEKLREKIIQGAAILRKNQQLITLRTDLPAHWDVAEKLNRRSPDWAAVKELARKMDLHSLRREIEQAEHPKAAAKPEKDAGEEFVQDDLFN